LMIQKNFDIYGNLLAVLTHSVEIKEITKELISRKIFSLSVKEREFFTLNEWCFSQKFRESNMPHDVFTKFLSNDDERIFHNFKTK